ncbi:hypothetical protein ACOSQ2_027209 [Xanthoceras sorbifolium]
MNINICISRIATSTKQQDHVHKPKDKPQGVSLRQPQAQGKSTKSTIPKRSKVQDRSKVFVPHSAQSSKFTHVCHHCGVKGHIRPWCYQYTSICKLVLNSKSLGKLKYVNVIDKKVQFLFLKRRIFKNP